MDLPPQLLSILAITGCVAGVLGVFLTLGAHRRIDRMRRTFALLQAGESEETFVEIVGRNIVDVEMLRAEIGRLRGEIDGIRSDIAAAIRHVAVLRYDAFDDIGGRLSWSAAMLDDQGDGLVMSAIAGRTDTRTYAKGVRHGSSVLPLSPEERQVLAAAIGAARRAQTA